jgi:hypothetical protein
MALAYHQSHIVKIMLTEKKMLKVQKTYYLCGVIAM